MFWVGAFQTSYTTYESLKGCERWSQRLGPAVKGLKIDSSTDIPKIRIILSSLFQGLQLSYGSNSRNRQELGLKSVVLIYFSFGESPPIYNTMSPILSDRMNFQMGRPFRRSPLQGEFSQSSIIFHPFPSYSWSLEMITLIANSNLLSLIWPPDNFGHQIILATR